MNMGNQEVLAVKDLQISFRSRGAANVAVRDISFSLMKGETLAIVGESGSGKSVTSLSIMQLLPTPPASIDKGSIHFNDGVPVDLSKLSEKGIIKYRGAKIAMIFQEPMSALNPGHKCGHQVGEMLEIHTSLDKARIKVKVLETFAKVDLPEPARIYDSYPHELSGGQLQRIMIAMAIICEPDVLIADEPTTALDVTIQGRVVDLLNNLKKSLGISTIFITHDLGLVKKIADRVMVMFQGEVVEQGQVDQIFNSPKHPYTKGLIACRPPLVDKYTRLPTIASFLDTDLSIEQVIQPLRQTREQTDARQSMLSEQPVLLQAEGLKKYYVSDKSFWGKPTALVKAVDDVSFEIRKGETLGLVGESGCGKSTLAKVLMRLIEATSGDVHFEGKSLFDLKATEMRSTRKDYQIIFQDPYGSLNPRMRVGKAIIEPLEIHRIGANKHERKEIVIDMLEKVGLEADHFGRYPHQFSGGQRQRICIARAVALRPKFILCDESVSALDVSVQAQVLNLLKDLRDELDLSYLFITHDLSVVKFISDRILVMKAGKIVEEGNSDAIINSPQNPYTQMLVDAIPR